MARQCLILVDNSNVFIGGRQLSAERKGVHGKNHRDRPVDPSWRLNFDELLAYLANGREVCSAIMVGSSPPDAEEVWEAARQAGFKVIVHDRSGHGEKAVDTEIAVRGAEIIAQVEEPMDLVIASGDRDYVPLVDAAHRHRWDVELVAFSNSFDPKGEVAQRVEHVRTLDDGFEKLGHCEFEWP